MPQSCSRPLPTHASAGDSWTLTGKSGSVSCGVTAPFSWVLVHIVLFVPSKSLFPQSCVTSGGSVAGLMVTSPKRAYAAPRSAAPRAPAPVAGHCGPIPLPETLKHSSVGLWVLVCTRFVWPLQASLVGMEFDSWRVFTPPTILLGLLLCPWMWVAFWWDPAFSCRQLFSSEL